MDRIGKYEVLDKIGSGGFAIVYKGHDPYIKRPVAIKVCYSRDEETRQRFFREAEIAGSLVHRNITTVYDFGLHEQMPYLIEEYLPGEDLTHMIKRREPEQLTEKLDYLVQIASGLDHAHRQGVIHRDIKPGNIRVLESGRLKIMDFGTAKLADVESNLTQAGMTLGTVAYLSPERLLGKPSGLNSDIFSYGVMAYELLSFRRPFSGRNIPNLIDQVLNAAPLPLGEVWPECPPLLAGVVHRCLAKDPAERYVSCTEVLKDLETVLGATVGLLIGAGQSPASTSAPTSVDSSATDGGADTQVFSLLERGKELFQRQRYERAAMLAEEVLEMSPDHPEALRLLHSCRQASDGDQPTSSSIMPPAMASPAAESPPAAGSTRGSTREVENDSDRSSSESLSWEGPEERRRRKVSEAVDSIQAYIARGQLVAAIDATRFASQLFGRLDKELVLRQQMIEKGRHQLIEMKSQGHQLSRQISQWVAKSEAQIPIDVPSARRLAFWMADLDPHDESASRWLAAVEQRAEERTAAMVTSSASDSAAATGADAGDDREGEAVASIERLLADGDLATARQALDFARGMLGEFPRAADLEARLSKALAKL